MNSTYGYVRVSSRDQNEARQLTAMREFGVPAKNIYVDKQSGKDFEREQYKRLVRRLREDDVLVLKASTDSAETTTKYLSSGGSLRRRRRRRSL